MARGFLLGIIFCLVLALAGAYVAVIFGWVPANADARPSRLETWAAKTSLRATVDREAPKQPNPVALNDRNLASGIKLYAQNCAVCHGDSRGLSTNIGHGLYQKAPQLAKNGVEDDPDGVTFWKLEHGIRLTGMPSFGGDLNDDQLWQLTLFLKHMDKLPPKTEIEWKKVHVDAKQRPRDRE